MPTLHQLVVTSMGGGRERPASAAVFWVFRFFLFFKGEEEEKGTCSLGTQTPGLLSDVKGGGGERVPWHRGKPVLRGAWLHIWGVITVKTVCPRCVVTHLGRQTARVAWCMVTHLGRYYCQNSLPALRGYTFGALLLSKQTARVAWLHIWGVIIVKTDCPRYVVTHLGRYYCQNRLPALRGYTFGALILSKQTARVAWLHIWGVIIVKTDCPRWLHIWGVIISIVKTDCLISLSCCSSRPGNDDGSREAVPSHSQK